MLLLLTTSMTCSGMRLYEEERSSEFSDRVYRIDSTDSKISYRNEEIDPINTVLKLKWIVKANNGIANSGTPLFNDELVFPGFETEFALMAENGKALYFSDPEAQKRIREKTSDSLIIYHSEDKITVLNIYNGEKVFSKKKKSRRPFRFTPTVNTSFLVSFVSTFNILENWDIASNRKLWEFKTDTPIYDHVVVEKGVVYFGDEKKLYGLNQKTGEKVLEMETGRVSSNIIINDGILYAHVYRSGLVAIDLVRERELWKVEGKGLDAQIVLQEDTIFYSSISIKAIDKYKGDVIWETASSQEFSQDHLSLSDSYIFSYYMQSSPEGVITAISKQGNMIFSGWQPSVLSSNVSVEDNTEHSEGEVILNFVPKAYQGTLYASFYGSVYAFKILNL